MLSSPIAGVFAIDRVGDNVFSVGAPLAARGRLLGSGVIATSTLAARSTFDGTHRPVGIHTTFVRAGDNTPVTLEIDRVHDGRSMVVRTVRAVQHERTVATSTIRFHDEVAPVDTSPAEWEPGPPDGRVPPAIGRPADSMVATMQQLTAFDIRAAVPPGTVEGRIIHPYWIRAKGEVPDRPGVHEALVGLFTDIGVSVAAAAPGTPFRDVREAVSLDHVLWWHRPPRIDEWLCIDAEPLVNNGGRGLARGTVRDEHGTLVASFAQEALLVRS